MPRSLTSRDSSHIGKRDKSVIIERLVESLPDSNFPTEAFVTLRRVWASREYISLDERTTDAQMKSVSMERWEIPYTVDMDPDRQDVTKTRRINYLGRVRNIIAAEVLPREVGQGILLTTNVDIGNPS